MGPIFGKQECKIIEMERAFNQRILGSALNFMAVSSIALAQSRGIFIFTTTVTFSTMVNVNAWMNGWRHGRMANTGLYGWSRGWMANTGPYGRRHGWRGNTDPYRRKHGWSRANTAPYRRKHGRLA